MNLNDIHIDVLEEEKMEELLSPGQHNQEGDYK
jgi:hypothetical protein